MIRKVYEIVCDWCGNADFSHASSYSAAEDWYRDSGGVAVTNKYHYCNESCQQQHIKAQL